MRRAILLLTLVGAMLLACSGVLLAQTPTPVPSQSERYIVVLKDDAAQNAGAVANELARRHGLRVSHTYRHALKGFAARIPSQRLSAVRSDPRVEFVSEDGIVREVAQWMPTGVNRMEADLSSTRAGNGSGAVNADIAILDTGIYRHPDLNVVGGYNCTSSNRAAWSDVRGHGTHVAGTAAAKDDTGGVVGAAPGARLWALKVLNDQGWGYTSWVICGIDWVTRINTDAYASNNIEVANMSLGGSGYDDRNCGYTNNDAEHRAICRSVMAGATYAVAAGNSGVNAYRQVPASYDEVITVSALADYNGRPYGGAGYTCRSDSGRDDTFATWSNYGADVDLGAPGVCILSTLPGGGYGYKSGTSMASPHVAGAAALVKARYPILTPSQVRAYMVLATNSEALGAGHTDPSGKHPERVVLAKNY